MLATQILVYKKRIIYNDQVASVLGKEDQFTIQKSINVIHYINRRKGKKTHGYLIRCRKIWQNLTLFHDKKTQQLAMKGNFLSVITST